MVTPVTVDSFTIDVHRDYALQTRRFEEFQEELRVEEASIIPKQTEVPNWKSKPSQLDLLLDSANRNISWGAFEEPPGFEEHRLLPFSPAGIVPSLGSLGKQQEMLERVRTTAVKSPQEKKQQSSLVGCLEMVGVLNEWASYAMGKMTEMVRG